MVQMLMWEQELERKKWEGGVYQWMETNQSNFRIYPTDVHLLLPHGTTLTAIRMLNTDVCGC